MSKPSSDQKVVELLAKSKSPMDVMELTKRLRVNKTTIYRQIESLINSGKVVEVDLLEGKKRYELKSLGHHHHLICRNCNNVEDVTLDEEKLVKNITVDTGFKIDSHNLEFFGLCGSCIKNIS